MDDGGPSARHVMILCHRDNVTPAWLHGEADIRYRPATFESKTQD